MHHISRWIAEPETADLDDLVARPAAKHLMRQFMYDNAGERDERDGKAGNENHWLSPRCGSNRDLVSDTVLSFVRAARMSAIAALIAAILDLLSLCPQAGRTSAMPPDIASHDSKRSP
jgi:hypothetical protein